MTLAAPAGPPSAAAPAPPVRPVPLDDVMIAMDVVDELRHDRIVVERELDEDGRRKQLIERLREIYKGQGIEVPDAVLEEGVRALEQDRFVYKPPKDGLATRLAKLYVSRERWGRYAAGALLAVVALWLVNYIVVERPRAIAEAGLRQELGETLPRRLKAAEAAIVSESRDAAASARASALLTTGLNAAAASDAMEARRAVRTLEEMLARLREEFEVRVVTGKGEVSGLWRIPRAAPDSYNYYLVVEAVDGSGRRLEQTIDNEETGKREKVRTWAVRVDRAQFEAVRADKADDGIIQRAVVGRKVRGLMEPTWSIPVLGGALTRW